MPSVEPVRLVSCDGNQFLRPGREGFHSPLHHPLAGRQGPGTSHMLFKHPAIEWSRITPFQDRMMVIMCRRLLPEAETRDIYLQCASSFKLPKKHIPVKVYCSPHNQGARELAEELNGIWPGLLQIANISENVFPITLSGCDHVFIYLNALTWTHKPEELAAEIREAACASVCTCNQATNFQVCSTREVPGKPSHSKKPWT